MSALTYFAYGSNMSSRRLRQRVPSARPAGTAALAGHRLAWHKKGRDGSGKCDIHLTDGDDLVYGVVYRIDPADKPRLDRAEGLGWGYQQKDIPVRLLRASETLIAFTYYAIRVDPAYIPYDWYRDHVLIGAREHGLPEPYIRQLENVPAFEDPDRRRERSERDVHT